MYSSVLICTLLVTATFAKYVPSLSTAEDTVYHVAECVRKALDGGLPAAGIPTHRPLTVPRNFSLSAGDGTLLSAQLNLTTIQIHGLIDYHFTDLQGEWNEDTKDIIYNYTLVYPEMRITFDYASNVRVLVLSHEISGSTDLSLQNLAFSGTYNQNTESWHLNDFKLRLNTDNVDFKITGLDTLLTFISDEAVAAVVKTVINANLPFFTETFVPALQDRLNNLWFNEDHWYRVQAILDNC